MNAHAFVTGASGFLGSEVCRVLVARGLSVHGFARGATDRAGLDELGIRWHAGDVRDASALDRALAEVRREAGGAPLDVVHAAAMISYRTRDARLQREVNVGGTRCVLEACRVHGARRLVHVSSVVAVGHSPSGVPMSEEHPYNGHELGVDYVNTKRAAEELALASCDALDVVVVNPAAIFGPAGERSNSALFLRRAAAGRVWVAPPGSVAVLGVGDAAEACALALERGARGRRYLLAESNLELRALVDLVARASGGRPARGRVPAPIWATLEHAARLVDRVRPLERLTPQSMRMVASRFPCDARRARAELGWRPRPFAEVIRDALERLGVR